VAITGAAGGVATMTRRHPDGHFDQIVVSERREIPAPEQTRKFALEFDAPSGECSED
jgi:hypothetical protein